MTLVYFFKKVNITQTKQNKKKKNSDTSGLVKKLDYNAKSSDIKSKIPSITGLAINSELTAVESKIPDVRSLVKKTNKKTPQKLVKLDV